MQRQRPQRPIKKRLPRRTKANIKASQAKQKQKSGSKNRLVLAIIAIVAVISIIAGSTYYMMAVQPFQRVILSVGDDNVKAGYFIKRMVASQGMSTDALIQSLTAELVVKQQAMILGMPVITGQEIDDFLHNTAKGDNESISDEDYNNWFQQQQDSTGLTAAEFKQIAASQIQAQRIQEIIGANINTEVPQVHLSIIVLGDSDSAAAAKARIDDGESFGDVAKEVSLDTTSKENGGDLGWQVPSLLNTQISSVLDALDIGKCSDPVALTQTDSTTGNTSTNYVLLMVTEKSAAMQVTDTQLSQLKYMAFVDWLNQQEAGTEVVFHGLNGSTTLDEQTSTWLTYQAQKLIKKLSSSNTTGSTTSIPTESIPETPTP
jgi:parvulin-like peptidyl-prolyl isomerase